MTYVKPKILAKNSIRQKDANYGGNVRCGHKTQYSTAGC